MASTPGWHPDPSGRHQHRFWDGDRWTDQVSDGGTTGTDPVDAAPGVPAAPGAAAPGAPAVGAPATGRSKGPLFVGLAVLAALVVAGIVFLVSGGDDDEKKAGGDGTDATSEGTDGGDDAGAGDFTLTVTPDELTVHPVDLAAGDGFAVRATGAADVQVAIGIDRANAEELLEIDGLFSDGTDLSSIYSDSNDAVASDLFSDLTDEQADVLATISDDPEAYAALPGYDGVLLYVFDYDELADDYEGGGDAKSSTLVAPADLDLSVLLISEDGEQEVDLKVRTTSNPDAPDTFDSDAYEALYSDGFYTDFFSASADELGVVLTDDLTDGTDLTDFTDDFTDYTDFSDDFTDFSDDFTDAPGGTDEIDSVTRPSTEEIAGALRTELGDSAPDGLITCVAEELYASELPNGVLQSLVEGDEAEVDAENERRYTDIITEAGTTCAGEAFTS